MPLPDPTASLRQEPRPSGGEAPFWLRLIRVLALGAGFYVAARIPLPTGMAFQAYLFWPAAALSYTAFFILGMDAAFGLLLGSLTLNLLGWLPWPQALAMSVLQMGGPLLAWQVQVHRGLPHPDLGKLRDLLSWLATATLASLVFSAGLGTLVVGSALPGGFHTPLSTALSWFLGDLAAIVCLGPLLLLYLPRPATPSRPLSRALRKAWIEPSLVALLCALLLLAGSIHADLSRDFQLALQFALVLPVLWMALRLGPTGTALGTALLSMAFLASVIWSGPRLPEEAFRFSQLFLLVLALAAHVTAAATEEARTARRSLDQHELQAQRMEAVGTLSGGLVHEFNNELTILLGNLDRLREHLALDRQAQAFTDRIEASALALGRTVQHLKDLSNQAPVEVSRISLQEALAPFLATLTNLPARIRVTTEWPEGLILCLDPERLRLALQALVANSLEAIPDQGHLRLWAEADGDILRLVLEDDGRGMPPEVLERAFDPFFSTKPVGSGRGLGLSIAFSLARQMGGELLLDSRLGQGTRAELRFPLTLPREACAPAGLRVPRRNRVLLADDEVSIRELTRECLEADGFQVSEAGDGIEALSRFETDPEGWDLVILDLIMPRMHGSEVLQRIHARRPDLPVLLISGYSSEARPDLLVGPHRRFLAKPFRLRDLRTVLTELGLSPSPPA